MFYFFVSYIKLKQIVFRKSKACTRLIRFMEVFLFLEIQKTNRGRKIKTLPAVNLGEIRDLNKNGYVKSYFGCL